MLFSISSPLILSFSTQERPPIITIEDAIAKGSFFPTEHKLETGDVETGFAESDHILEGQMKVTPGQEVSVKECA